MGGGVPTPSAGAAAAREINGQVEGTGLGVSMARCTGHTTEREIVSPHSHWLTKPRHLLTFPAV